MLVTGRVILRERIIFYYIRAPKVYINVIKNLKGANCNLKI